MVDHEGLTKFSIGPPNRGSGEASVPSDVRTELSVCVVVQACDESGRPVAIKHVSVSKFRHAFLTKYKRGDLQSFLERVEL
jgi:hypothetical protein